jgi:hypothetical protein
MRASLFPIAAALIVLLGGCGFFDSGIVWRGGPYALTWIDIPDDVRLEYDRGDGGFSGRIEPRVFAVGWNKRYLVAKQHPSGDRSVTNFFVIDATADSADADHEKVVRGPLTEGEFQRLSSELSLPPFSKVLASLE